MRYTECRMSEISHEMLADIDKETVEFVPNYDESTSEPTVLPTIIPNLLINGSSGIAVGMATNIPPHNITEVCEATIRLIDTPEIPLKELMSIINGPDFPTGGIILGRKGIKEYFRTGRGSIKLRGCATVEEGSSREKIIITEIPYQVNKTNLIEGIADLAKEKKIEGISDIRDESSREGMRIVIELKRGVNGQIVLNHLYKYTKLEVSYGVIMLVIVGGQPKVLSIREVINRFISFRSEIIVNRTKYDLKKSEERAHILEGLIKALEIIDEIIKLFKSSSDGKEAKARLIDEHKFSDIQAQTISDMRLQRLTGLERNKINDEYQEIITNITRFKTILGSQTMVMQIIKNEIQNIIDKYGDKRKTRIVESEGEVKIEDLIPEEDVAVTISHDGYIKRSSASNYRIQKRGGKGSTGFKSTDDFATHFFVASSHDYLLFFTNKGKAYLKKIHEIPEAGKLSRGKAIINLLSGLDNDEKVATTLNFKKFKEDRFVVMTTKKGLVKKTSMMAYSRPRTKGIIAIGIREDDELISARITNGKRDIFITTSGGKCIRFSENNVRDMGRGASGIKGIRLSKKDNVVAMDVIRKDDPIMIVTENGYGKRSSIDEYRQQYRGGSGIKAARITNKNGPIIYTCQVSDDDQLMIITSNGKIIRVKVTDISMTSRPTQGVRLVTLSKGEKVVGAARIEEDE